MLSNQRKKFSIPTGFTYLNCAYMSPLLKSVEKAGIKGVIRKRNPFDIPPPAFFTDSEILRQEFAKLIHVKNANQIAIIPSASYGLANAARNIKLSRGQNIVIASEQFPSNYYIWQRLCTEKGAEIKIVNPPDTLHHRGKIWNERILDAINNNTKVVALESVHWADGTLFDLLAIRKRTKEAGAFLIIDGTQSVGALPFDVEKVQPDVLVCSGYKWLLAPYSISLAYYSEIFNDGIPIEESWINRLNSEDFTRLANYQQQYQPGALRYEVGEHSNFILVPMMIESLRQINKWKPENIQQYCAKITRKPLEKLQAAGFWVEDEKFRGHHLFGIRVPVGYDKTKPQEELKRKKISVSFRGDAIRVSPHLYNSEDELMKLVHILTH